MLPPPFCLCFAHTTGKVSWGNFGNGVTPGILHLQCCSFGEREVPHTNRGLYDPDGMPNAQTWPSNQHSSSLTSAQEPCTYNYSKTPQKMFLLKPIRSQANTTALSTIYQHSNACPAWTEVLNARSTDCKRKIKRSKVESRMRRIQKC